MIPDESAFRYADLLKEMLERTDETVIYTVSRHCALNIGVGGWQWVGLGHDKLVCLYAIPKRNPFSSWVKQLNPILTC